MNILVTGSAGYIGSHTAKAFLKAGHTPIVYNNLSRGHADAVLNGTLVQGDLSDTVKLLATLTDRRIDAILHFAAFAYVGESMSQPCMYFENNTVNSYRQLEVATHDRVNKIVFSSACATYGDPVSPPINEQHPQIHVNPCGESKLMVEKLLRWYGECHGIDRVAALRHFNAAGCDPSTLLGERHDSETHLIPLVLRANLSSDARLPSSASTTPRPMAPSSATTPTSIAMKAAAPETPPNSSPTAVALS